MDAYIKKLEEIKTSPSITRSDIAALLALIGAPGEKTDTKLDCIKQLGLSNTQGIALETTLEDYQEY